MAHPPDPTMAVSTRGIALPEGSRALRDAVELLSSMRFAISLLTLISIASVIGTVIKQNEPGPNYVNQFGPFWSQLFNSVGLTQVYSTWWFLLILAFLVLSTSLCIARNTPKILSDLRHYKENLREQSLQAFHHRGEAELDAESLDEATARMSRLLDGQGWRAKLQERRDSQGALIGRMVAARKGAANKLGYIAAHSAIVLICVGGLLDGDLVVRLQMLLQGKHSYSGEGLVSEVPAQYRLGPDTLTFRGSIDVPEGGRRRTALIAQQDGVVLQDLPFDIELKKFIVDYYSTGMPKLFASDIVIHDHETGQAIPARVKVNEPAFHRGIAIYQSSFDDGGSMLKLHAVPLGREAKTDDKGADFQAAVGTRQPLPAAWGAGAAGLSLEITGFRAINVENFAAPAAGQATDVRKVDLVDSLSSHLGSGAKARTQKELRNVGASFTYKLRDAAGQAREFNNYMAPVELDGQRVMLAGVRDNPADNFRYLRIPVDEQDDIASWLHLRRALQQPALREAAARRYVRAATPQDKPEMGPQLELMAKRTLALFAGESPAALPASTDDTPMAGLPALSQYLEQNVPAAERNRISELLLRVLSGSLFELMNAAREGAGLPPMASDGRSQAFMTQTLLSLSDSFFYPAPVLLQLNDYRQVQASVFQVARAPGKTLVYLGCGFLIMGVFAMLYIRERRLWIWLQPASAGHGTRVVTAMSTSRRTLDADAEFDALKQAILNRTVS